MYDPRDPKSIERYSSAVTLSDMEVFIFPELMLSLVLANCMSPRIWAWRNDSWFGKSERQAPTRRVQRLKQYIMDHFAFNLDLDTWGLTTKEQELARFSDFIDEQILAESNALFGYEGDKYYFDIDIRKHFGLDKYNSSIIPYWKTETLEAMEAFRYKEGYPAGAGECVSLAALYASAAFAVAGVAFDDIFILATPLHSQNYLNIGNGILTNNRRIVTKNMWFNGTELSAKARRALEKERVTIVAHRTGYIHTIYPQATIHPDQYRRFKDRIRDFLKTEVSFEILANFLRQNSKLQCCFQIAHSCCGKSRFIEAEKVFHYEHSSKARVGDSSQNMLLHEIEEDEFYTEPLPNRLLLGELEAFFKVNKMLVDESSILEKLKVYLRHSCFNVEEVLHDLKSFCRTNPRLPDTSREWIEEVPIDLDGVGSAEEVVERLEAIRAKNLSADLAFSAFRDLTRSPWKPFLKAAFERNPVCISATQHADIDSAFTKLHSLESDSIYPGVHRLAQPDEVWNFGRGDGLEKAVALVNIIRNRFPDDRVMIDGDAAKVRVTSAATAKEYVFHANKKVDLPVESDYVW